MCDRDYGLIPPRIMHGLCAWALAKHEVGDFLTACLANDFIGGVCRADEQSFKALAAIAVFIHNELPSRCHGSREKVEAWAKLIRAGAIPEDVLAFEYKPEGVPHA